MPNVVIVGAGVIGLFCAARLALAGARVTVLEGQKEDFSPFEPTASLAAAGMLAPLTDGAESTHPGFDQLALESFDLWRRFSKDAPWEDGVRFEGTAIIAADPDAFVAKVKSLGRATQPMSVAQWRKRSGFEAPVENAVFVEDEGVADPIRVLSGLVMEARRYGAQVRYGVDVTEVTGARVTASSGAVFEADHVLLAPGVWAPPALQDAAPALKHIRPAKGQLIPVTVTQPLGVTVRAHDFYLARRIEDIVLGASFQFDRYDRHPDPARAAELLAAAERVLPGEVRARDRGWAGVRPMSPDAAPMIGKSGEVLVACGHSRNGWLLAPATAEIICAVVLGDALSPLWASFTPDRFEKTS